MTQTRRAAVAVASSGAADAELIALGAALAELDAKKSACADNDEERSDLYEEHWALRERINRIPATTIEGLRAKAQAAEFALKWDADAGCRCDGAFFDLARSINQDIIALAGQEARS